MYIAGFLTLVTSPLWSQIAPPLITLVTGALCLLPGGIDGTTQMFGNRESTNRLRAITGFLLGIGVVLITHGSVYLAADFL